MLMNAQPRAISNGFRTFVPAYKLDPSRQGLFEMTSNDVNAWNAFGPVVPSSLGYESWDQFGSFRDDDNYSASSCTSPRTISSADYQKIPLSQDYYGVSFEDQIPYSQVRTGLSRTSAHNTSSPEQQQVSSGWPIGQFKYQLPPSTSGYSHKPMWMFTGTSQNWTTNNNLPRTTSMSRQEFTPEDRGLNDRHSDYRCYITQPSTNPIRTTSSFRPINRCDVNEGARMCPNSVYSNYYSSEAAPAAPMDVSFSSLAVDDSPADENWWTDFSQNTGAVNNNAVSFGYDELPNNMDINDTWVPRDLSSNEQMSWSDQTLPFNTISPQALQLSSSTTASSSPATSSDFVFATSPVNRLRNLAPLTDSQSATVTTANSSHRGTRSRQPLPSEPVDQNHIPTMQGNSQSGISEEGNSISHIRRLPWVKDSPKVVASGSQNSLQKATKNKTRTLRPARIEPKPDLSTAIPCVEDSDECPSQDTAAAARVRTAKDEFLVRSKRAGMSYRDIRKQGGFTEAESTLRGRYRTLTKQKNERVRKPEWEEKDVRLLKKAVQKLTKNSDTAVTRVPWKLVAEYISDNGGSYHFGNATCRKRWDELQSRSGK